MGRTEKMERANITEEERAEDNFTVYNFLTMLFIHYLPFSQFEFRYIIITQNIPTFNNSAWIQNITANRKDSFWGQFLLNPWFPF